MCNTCKHDASKNTSSSIPNKFQSLIESPDVHPYSAEERQEKTVEISKQHFEERILPAIKNAADVHVEARKTSIESKFESDS